MLIGIEFGMYVGRGEIGLLGGEDAWFVLQGLVSDVGSGWR